MTVNPGSLWLEILRAKYFPNGSLLQATLKNGASFTWQSNMAGVNSLKMVISGELAMERISISGEMLGSREDITLDRSHQRGIAGLIGWLTF